VFIYLDDILVASKSRDEHLAHLRAVFQVLDKAGLVINAEKSLFLQEQIDFLDHKVCADGIAPLPEHVQAILDFKQPGTLKELQLYLGLLLQEVPAISRQSSTASHRFSEGKPKRVGMV
jgi:hypothetical protein